MNTFATDPIYDVAISFRWPKLRTARALYKLLRDQQMEVFFADEQQEVIVGTDGEERFANVFRDQARVVVIFYSDGWGETPFTRAEMHALRQRARLDGWSYTVWVPLDGPSAVPGFLPQEYIHYDWERYKLKGLASVVAARVRESGKQVRPPSPMDEIKRLKLERERAAQIEQFRFSPECAAFTSEVAGQLPDIALRVCDRITEADDAIRFDISVPTDAPGAFVRTRGWQLGVYIKPEYRSTLRMGELNWKVFRAKSDESWGGTNWEVLKHEYCPPTVTPDGIPAWERGDDEVSTEQLVEELVMDLATRVAKALAPSKPGRATRIVTFR